ELPGGRGIDGHAGPERGAPPGAGEAGGGRLPALEARPGGGAGPAGAAPARPPAFPQGPVPVPLLRPPRPQRPAARRLARPGLPDRPAPAGAPPVDVVVAPGEGPGATALLVHAARRRRARPGGLLEALPRPRGAQRLVELAAPGHPVQV